LKGGCKRRNARRKSKKEEEEKEGEVEKYGDAKKSSERSEVSVGGVVNGRAGRRRWKLC
jgi:hypothetical protein